MGSAFFPTMSPLPIDFFPVAYGRQCYICSDFQKIRYPLLNFYKCYQSKYSSRLLWQQNENSLSCSPFFCVCLTLEHKGEGRWASSSSALCASVGSGYRAALRSSLRQFEEGLSFPKRDHQVFPKAGEPHGHCCVPNAFESLALLVGIPCCEEQACHAAVAKSQLWH